MRDMKKWVADVIASPKKQAVPVLSFPSVQLMGVSVKDLVSDSAVQARGMIEVAKRCPTGASLSMMDLSVEAEAFGAAVKFSEDEIPVIVGSIVNTKEDAAALVTPEVGAARTGVYVAAIEKAAQEIQDRPVLAGCIGPLSLCSRLLDMSQLLVNCRRAPEINHIVLEKATEFLIRYAKSFKEVGANGIVIAEPVAGLVSPKVMKEFSAKYCKRIVDEVQDDSFIVIYHNCGEAVPKMVPEIIEIGAAGVHFGDAVQMAELVEQFPADVLVMGNISPVHCFLNGSVESMKQATAELLERCGKHPNFVISSGCDIPPTTPWENIDAFFEVVEAG